MKIEDRAAQMWPVLALAARNRQMLTYSMMKQLTGMATVGVGKALEPIQSYCLLHKLPPLTALVVNDSTGLPGIGFIAAADVPKRFWRSFGTTGWSMERQRQKTSQRPMRSRPAVHLQLDLRPSSLGICRVRHSNVA